MDRQFLTKSTGISLLVAIVLFSAFAAVSAGEASTPVSWHNISQVQRNAKILAQANNDVKYQNANGNNCKDYVKGVVKKASGGLVALPATSDNNYSWKPDSNVAQVYASGPVCMIRWVSGLQPGQIIQMLQANGVPHTAIVYSEDSGGNLWVVDSNYSTPPDGKVRLHQMMANKVVGYSVYGVK